VRWGVSIMPKRKSMEVKETKADIVDKLVGELEGDVLLAGALGAVAAAGGIVPPFTSLLSAIPNGSTAAFDAWKAVAIAGSPVLTIAEWFGWLQTGDTSGKPIAQYAIAASGALEAMMMMTLMKNPATIEAIGNAVSGVGKTAGALL